MISNEDSLHIYKNNSGVKNVTSEKVPKKKLLKVIILLCLHCCLSVMIYL